MSLDQECDHRWTPRGNGISICELCSGSAFSSEDVETYWPGTSDDLNILSFAAFRYALGRKTYIVEMVCNSLIRNAECIRRDVKNRMREDIVRAIDNNDAGMECDIVEWRKVLEAFE